MNHVALAGLLVDAIGAVLLARAAIFERAPDYVAGRGTPKWDYDARADAVRAADASDARVGASLLALGFIGQGAAAAGVEACPAVAYGAATVVAALGAIAWLRARTRFERELLRARVISVEEQGGRLTYQNGESVIEHYGRAMGGSDRRSDETLHDYAERVFGSRVWRSMDWINETEHPELFLAPAAQHESYARSSLRPSLRPPQDDRADG